MLFRWEGIADPCQMILHRGSLRPSHFRLSASLGHRWPMWFGFQVFCPWVIFCFPPRRVLLFLSEEGEKQKKVNILALQLPPVWGCRGDGSTQGSPIMSPFSSSPSSSSLFTTSSSLSLPASPLLMSNFGAACDSTAGWFGRLSVTSLNFPDKCGAPNFKSCFPTLWVAENRKKCKRSILRGCPVHSSTCVGAVQPANWKQLVVFTLEWFCLNFRLIWERKIAGWLREAFGSAVFWKANEPRRRRARRGWGINRGETEMKHWKLLDMQRRYTRWHVLARVKLWFRGNNLGFLGPRRAAGSNI